MNAIPRSEQHDGSGDHTTLMSWVRDSSIAAVLLDGGGGIVDISAGAAEIIGPEPTVTFERSANGFRSSDVRVCGHAELPNGTILVIIDHLERRAPGTEDAPRRHRLDDLTGLPTRDALNLAADELEDAEVVVLFIDLDGFKAVNDTLGHETGDLVLAEIGSRLAAVVEERCDPTAIAARWGGDEFVVLTPWSTDVAGLSVALQRGIAESIDAGGHRIALSASIGVAFGIPGDWSLRDLVRVADDAMYVDKHGPRPVRATLWVQSLDRDRATITAFLDAFDDWPDGREVRVATESDQRTMGLSSLPSLKAQRGSQIYELTGAADVHQFRALRDSLD